MWPYIGDITDIDGNNAGNIHINCFRTDNAEAFYCTATANLEGYKGLLTWVGRYPNDTVGGQYTIVGGTHDFAHAVGIVTTDFDLATGQSTTTIDFQ